MENLNIAFPEKTKDEKKRIARKFFRNFTDFIIESIKNFSLSEKSLSKRYHFENLEEIEAHVSKTKRGAAIAAAHQFNWEYMIYVAWFLKKPIQAYISYTLLSNKVLDGLIRKNRERFGLKLASAGRFIKTIENAPPGELSISGLISDQSPKANYKFRAPFFGVEVPMYTGPENIARKFNHSYWFLRVTKVKRGHYSVYFELITSDPHSYQEGELTRLYIQKMEDLIRSQPENYLWTHRRWKHAVN